MICSKCSSPIPDGYKFCVQCGSPVTGQVPQQGMGVPQPYQPSMPGHPYSPQPPVYPNSHPVSGYNSAAIRCNIEHGSAFALAVITLQPEQSIKAEAGAMVSMSANIELKSQAQGGLMGVLKRTVVGESAFINTFTAHNGPGELTLAPSSPGDIVNFELVNQTYFVQSGSFLAASIGIELDLQFGGAKSFFSGEGLFLIRLYGTGTLLLSSFGAIRKKQLAPGERYIVDTGHVVAFEAGIQYSIRKASQQGFFRSLVSGEGFVCEYIGPGTVFLQTRNLAAFAGVLKPFFPNQGTGGGFKVDF